MMKCVFIVGLLLAGADARAQFYFADSTIYFMPRDTGGSLLRGAAVFYNGRQMKESDSPSRAGSHYYFVRGLRPEMPPHLRILAGGYQPFNDTLYDFEDIRLMPRGQRDYYYHHSRVPCMRFPGWLFSRLPDEIPPDSLATMITLAGGELRDSFLLCGSFKGLRQEPHADALVYRLPPTAAGDSLRSWLYRNSYTGPYVELPANSYQRRTGFQDHFTIQIRPVYQDTASKLLQAWKASGRLLWFGQNSPYEKFRFRIQVPKPDVDFIVGTIESLLATGFFFDPVMEPFQFICLD